MGSQDQNQIVTNDASTKMMLTDLDTKNTTEDAESGQWGSPTSHHRCRCSAQPKYPTGIEEHAAGQPTPIQKRSHTPNVFPAAPQVRYCSAPYDTVSQGHRKASSRPPFAAAPSLVYGVSQERVAKAYPLSEMELPGHPRRRGILQKGAAGTSSKTVRKL